MREHRYFVYLMTNPGNRVLYTGVTGNLSKRVTEHRYGLVEGFSKKYNTRKLIYYEETDYINAALEREKQIKGWLRSKKIALIQSINPKWDDLSQLIGT